MEIKLSQTRDSFGNHSAPRSIRLAELNQSYVYEGLLEGLPTREMNLLHLQAIPHQVHTRFPLVPVEPCIIAPAETAIEYNRGKYLFGEPARLPSIQCVSRWESYEFGDLECDHSTLIIVWFQSQFALPIDASVIAAIKELDWNSSAHKSEY